ncbi:MAG: rps15p [Methanomicrobia archaeon]|nr:rps15p [Methanomicrobia archaeon]MBS1194748.1 rps15p [Methanomicrobia archaeon]MDD1634382.1 30S ribosomal protein S15 [Methanomicrobiales archaeon]MDD1639282.1 30S ribosomal protein S15 [Methanomicrobiales archaeon]MDD1646563.1 30S ribosomal protein S15 [Methanomicrobiales archaeon]
MARMHARRRGTSGSVRPYRKEVPAWSNSDVKEIEKVIREFRKQGRPASEIGLVLRDKYGVPDVKLVMGKRLGTILKEMGMEAKLPEDLANLIRKALGLRKHLATNKNDLHNKRQLQLTESKVRRLARYYVRAGTLPKDWTYKAESAEILLSR